MVIKKMFELASKNDPVDFVYRRIVKPTWFRFNLFVKWLPKSTGSAHKITVVSAIMVLA